MAFDFWRNEISVNTTTAGDQDRLNVRVFNDGRFIISWGSTDTGDGNLGTARARVFDVFGAGTGNDYIIASTTAGGAERPRIHNMNNGNKLAVFLTDANGVSNNLGDTIKGRILNSNGVPTGSDFTITSGAANTIQGSFLARFNDGSFGVVYTLTSTTPGDGNGRSAWIQRLDANGALVGTAIQINSVTTGDQVANDFAQFADSSGYLGLYQSSDAASGDGNGGSLHIRTFDAAFNATGNTVINNVVAGDQNNGLMARLNDGTFVIAYESTTGDAVGTSSWFQFLTTTGAANGAAIRVNSTEDGDQSVAGFAQLNDGRLFFVWRSSDTGDGSSSNIRGRLFNAAGVAEGADFIINTTTTGDQSRPTVRLMQDGRVIVAWETGATADPNGKELKAQIFDPRGDAFFTNGAATTVGSDNNNIITGNNNNETIYGIGGDDTLNGMGGNDLLFGDTGADQLNGGDGDDYLAGGAGADSLNGGNGTDIVAYENDAAGGGGAGVVVNLSSNSVNFGGVVAANSARDGFGTTDTLTGIEQARGTAQADVFVGGTGSSFFQGRAGADTYVSNVVEFAANFYSLGFSMVDYRQDGGTVGVNINLGTGTGTDSFGATETFTKIVGVRGTMLADTLTGSQYWNLFQPLQGADNVNGGAGTDRVDYSVEASFGGTGGVTVNLSSGSATDGWGNTDTLVSIEEVIGTAQADNITGNQMDNFLFGGLGNDILIGGDGFDAMRPGAGTDTVDGSPLTQGDQSYGDRDRVDYSDMTPDVSGLGVIINLSNAAVTFESQTVLGNNARDTTGAIDTLIDIERGRGTSGRDYMRGSDTANLRNERFEGLAGNDYIDGGQGYNVVYYINEAPSYISLTGAGGTSGIIVNLSSNSITYNTFTVLAGQARDAFGATDTLINIRGIGGTGLADYVVGGAGYDFFTPFGGADFFDGGGGDRDEISFFVDEQFYGVTGAGVTVNMAAGTATQLDGSTMTFVNVETISGSERNDNITGDGNRNRISGDTGDDFLDGAGGDDILTGGAGNDTLQGGDGIDIAYFGYDPTFAAWAADNRVGLFVPPSGGVSANLASQTASDAYGTTDILLGIEGLSGTFFNDSLTGDGQNNIFYGLSGDDIINGAGGIDTVSYANWGNTEGSGAPVLPGINASRPNGVIVNLASQTANDGEGGTDTLTDIENVVGSDGTDSIIGSAVANSLSGGLGTDTLTGAAGDDLLDGGAGLDIATYSNARNLYQIRSYNDSGVIKTSVVDTTGTNGSDTVTNIETLQFSDKSFKAIGAQGNKVSNIVGSRYDDIVFHNSSTGQSHVNVMGDGSVVGSAPFTNPNGAQWQAIDTADFNADGRADVIYRNTSDGIFAIGLTGNTGVVSGYVFVTTMLTTDFRLVGAADIDGDAHTDLLIQSNSTGTVYFGDMTGITFNGWTAISNEGTAWQARALADVNRDGRADVIYQNTTTGIVSAGLTTASGTLSAYQQLTGGETLSWTVKEGADVNNDGHIDVLIQNNANGDISYINMANGVASGYGTVMNGFGSAWQLEGVADTNNDGDMDAIIRNVLGSSDTYVVNMENGNFSSFTLVAQGIGSAWYVV